MPQPNEPATQEPAAPAAPAEPAQPAEQPQPNEPAAPAPAEPAGNEGAQPTPGEGGDGSQPSQQTRQERRDQERQSKGIGQLNQQPQQGQQPYQQQPGMQQPPSFPQYQAGQEVSPEQLQSDVVQAASAIADLQVESRFQQYDAKRNFESDLTNVPQTFAELNPDNDAYTPELDEAIAQEYQERALRVVGHDRNGNPIKQLDPSIRLADIAKRHVTGARALAAKLSASNQAGTNAAADTSAPRPTGAKPADRPFESLSRDEQRAKLGYHKQ